MSACNEVVRLLADFIEGQLPPHTHARLEQHLAACQACAAQVRTYRSTVGLLRSLTEEELPPDLRWSLKAFLDAGCRN